MGKRSRQSFLSSRLQDYQGSNIEAPNHFISLHLSHAHTVSSNTLRLKNRAAAGTGLRTSQSNRQEAQICISGPPKQLHHLALGLTSIINYKNINYLVIIVSPLDYSLFYFSSVQLSLLSLWQNLYRAGSKNLQVAIELKGPQLITCAYSSS